MELLVLVLAHVIIRAWEQARAQAGAEWRRARSEWGAEIGRRMAAGAAGGPGESWWWWLAAADRARRSMRGPRPGATATALPASTPFRRIRQAAWAGAVRGVADARQRAAERRASRRQARTAAGGSRTSWGGRRAAGASGYAAGWAWGHVPRPGRPNWHRPNFRDLRDLFDLFDAVRVREGVCDKCGAVCALSAMDYQHVDVGGRTETWLLCAQCRAESAPEQERDPLPAVAAPEEYAAVTGGHPSDGPLAVEAGDPDGDPVPAGTAGEPPSPGAPGPVPAAIEDAPYGELAARDNPTTSATEINGGQMREITPAVNRPGTEMELAGNRLPATGDAYNYGANARAEESEAQLLEDLGLYLDATVNDLTAVSASRRQFENTMAFVERVRTEAGLGREVTEAMDRRYKPLIAVAGAVGGPEAINDMSYYEEV